MPKTPVPKPITAAAVMTFLKSCKAMLDVRPCVLTVWDHTFEAAWYRQRMEPAPGARNQNPHINEAIYIPAIRPPRMRKARHVCYTRPDDPREWYNSCYIDEVTPPFAVSHPFGPNFMLAPWDTSNFPPQYKDDKIDTGERDKYVRLPLLVQWLGDVEVIQTFEAAQANQ